MCLQIAVVLLFIIKNQIEYNYVGLHEELIKLTSRIYKKKTKFRN